MKRKYIKMILIIPASVLLLLAFIFLLWMIISSGKIREYKDAKGNEIPGSISEKTIIEINGAKNGLIA